MGEIQIQKVQRTVQVKDADNTRKKVQKTYGKIIYRKTLTLDDMAEHIMKHGLDGIGTLYPTLTSAGVDNAKDFSATENVTRIGIAFLADQSRKSMYKARSMREAVNLSTSVYSELTGEDNSESGNTESGNNGNTENGGGSSSSGSNEGPVNP